MNIWRAIRSRAPLIVMVAGAVSVFACSVGLKAVLDPETYGYFGLVVTVLSVGQLLGLGGTEHALLRTAKVRPGEMVAVPTVGLLSCLVGFVGFAVLASVASRSLIPAVSPILLVGALGVVAANVFQGSLLRLLGSHARAQFALTFWRFLLPVWAVFAWSRSGSTEIGLLLWFVVWGGAIATIMWLPTIMRRVRTGEDSAGYGRLVLGFLLSIGSVSALSYGERFIMVRATSLDAFGQYFLAVNIIVFPFVLVSSYVGFIRLVDYKTEPDASLFFKDLWRSLAWGSIGVTLYTLGLLILLSTVPEVAPDVPVALFPILALTAALRLGYGPLSAAMGAHATAEDLFAANGLTLIAAAMLFGAGLLWASGVVQVALGLALAWTLRDWLFLLWSPMRRFPQATRVERSLHAD